MRVRPSNIALITILLAAAGSPLHAQHLYGRVCDAASREPLPDAIVRTGGGVLTFSDADGRFIVADTVGADVAISYLGYEHCQTRLTADGLYLLRPLPRVMRDVVVTATESRSLSTSSKIERHAMRHLQPSSLADVMELVPGGLAQDPHLSRPNNLRLREAGLDNDNYQTSRLGTAIVIDGAQMSPNATMQDFSGSGSDQKIRSTTNKGIDVRAIATDDIESVEVVRGVAPAEYGELTSGLVRLVRRRGGTSLNARLKTDMDTKLAYVAKGFEWQRDGKHGAQNRRTLNVSADYLQNRADPRNLQETFGRASASVRTSVAGNTASFATNLTAEGDYRGTFDTDKSDPEATFGGTDHFTQKINSFSFHTSFTLRRHDAQGALQRAYIDFALAGEHSVAHRTRLIQLDRETPAATTHGAGSGGGIGGGIGDEGFDSDAVIIYPYSYVAQHTVDGRPVTFFAKYGGEWQWGTGSDLHLTLKAGGDWHADKNYGRGQLFDALHPLYPGVTHRPRPYRDVPAANIAGLHATAQASLPLGRWRLEADWGARLTRLANLPHSYTLRGRFYLDPRINTGLTLPSFDVQGSPLRIRLTISAGQHTKMPTLAQLYPDPQYIDIVELNYFHPVREYRRMHLRTYVADPTNHSLRAARNMKWEGRADVSWAGHRLTLTAFCENMRHGFRPTSLFQTYAYRRYDASGIDAGQITSAPDVATLPYAAASELRARTTTINGSATKKQGVELTYASPRWQASDMRLTVTGAWLRTSYTNSAPLQERPAELVAGQRVNLVGIYANDSGYRRSTANTNFTLDSNLEPVGMGISLSAQCTWFTSAQNTRKSETPIMYIDADGTHHPFTPECLADPVLRTLARSVTNNFEEHQTVPFCMNLNLKATKRMLADKMMIALFANKVWDVNPDYVRNGYTIRRFVRPYFGLEINVKF